MSYSTSERSHFNSLVEKLRKKLNNFLVVNLQGDRIGIIKDIIVDRQHQLQLIISSENKNINPTIQLNSKQIKNIEIADKIVVVDLTIAATESSDLDQDVTLESDQIQHFSNRSSRNVGDNLDMHPSASPVMQSELLAQTAMIDKAQDRTEIQLNSAQDLSAEEIVKLLSERVIVDRKKRKIGEVIVRKEVETRMVEVPVRYEKLVVEQVNPERKQIVEINLGQETLTELESSISEAVNGKQHNLTGIAVSGKFDSPKIVSLLLNAIARERQHGCQQIRVEIVVDSPEKQKTYQEWFDRCSQQLGSSNP
jgi:stress response protein YsnF